MRKLKIRQQSDFRKPQQEQIVRGDNVIIELINAVDFNGGTAYFSVREGLISKNLENINNVLPSFSAEDGLSQTIAVNSDNSAVFEFLPAQTAALDFKKYYVLEIEILKDSKTTTWAQVQLFVAQDLAGVDVSAGTAHQGVVNPAVQALYDSLATSLAGKADANGVVTLSGDQEISGVKDFVDGVRMGLTYTPSIGRDVTNKEYVDNTIDKRGFKHNIVISKNEGEGDFIVRDSDPTSTQKLGDYLNQINAQYATNGANILIRNSATPYYFDDYLDRAILDKSNIMIDVETPGGVICQARGSLAQPGIDALSNFGMITFGKNQTVKQENVGIRGIIFDCNRQNKSCGLTIDGSSSMQGEIGIQNILVDKIKFINQGENIDDRTRSPFFALSGINQSIGNRGYIDGLVLNDVDSIDGNNYGLYFQGGNFTNVKILGGNISQNQRSGIYYFNYEEDRPTSSDWLLRDIRFEQNMRTASGTSQADFRDQTQNGIDNLTVDHCYFGPRANQDTDQDYCLTPYWAKNLRITGNTFDRAGAVSIGASVSGSYKRIFPVDRALIEGNIWYKTRSTFDPDSVIFMNLKNNIFYKVNGGRSFGMYSRHFPTMAEGNIWYDVQSPTPYGRSGQANEDYNDAAIQTNGDGIKIHNNIVIDDRKLKDPTADATAIGVAGGSLASRTYYYQYSFVSDTGETLPSPEQSITLQANQLFRFTGWDSSYAPSGAIKVKVYVGTASGQTKLKAELDSYAKNYLWTEPEDGLVGTGAAPVTTNTTHTLTKWGIYELEGGGGKVPNDYQSNYFVGIEPHKCIRESSEYKRYRKNNLCFTDDLLTNIDELFDEKIIKLKRDDSAAEANTKISLARGQNQHSVIELPIGEIDLNGVNISLAGYSNNSILGKGKGVSILKNGGLSKNNTTLTKYLTLKDFTVDINQTADLAGINLVNNLEDVDIDNVEIKNTNNRFALSWGGVSNLKCRNSDFIDAGISDGKDNAAGSQDVTKNNISSFINCKFTKTSASSGGGLLTTGSTGNLSIVSNFFINHAGTGYAGVSIEGQTGDSKIITISRNEMINAGINLGVDSNNSRIEEAHVDNNTFVPSVEVGQTIRGGIIIQKVDVLTLNNNSLTKGNYSIFCRDVLEATISNNRIQSPDQSGVDLDDRAGIYVFDCLIAHLPDNHVKNADNTGRYGIYVKMKNGGLFDMRGGSIIGFNGGTTTTGEIKEPIKFLSPDSGSYDVIIDKTYMEGFDFASNIPAGVNLITI